MNYIDNKIKELETEAELFFKECETFLSNSRLKDKVTDKIRLNTSKKGFVLIARNIERYKLKRRFKLNNVFGLKPITKRILNHV
jgi:hypothetical protein